MKVTEKDIKVSKPEKIMYPGDEYTKADIVTYYEKIFDFIFPFVRNRLLMLQRFPDGIKSSGFYQKELPDYFPGWIDRATVKKKEGGDITQVICNSSETMVYLANQACITFHTWLSRADKPDFPDKVILDLDPPGKNFNMIRKTLPHIREFLEKDKLNVFLMTTGSKGLHLVMPVLPENNFDKVKAAADKLAERLENTCGDQFTTRQYKNKREGRIYLDSKRNSYGQTAVAPYSLRAAKGAPVATPVNWDESLQKDFNARKYHIKNIFRRLSQVRDPWEDYFNEDLARKNTEILFNHQLESPLI
ncbi:MAG: non-homologous end-joining DNA ligase [Cyclobacteriaceae bacterium]|nr:non-homologous end-joining DNA ligase [Cyclobacteriaceae bacterium]